MRDLELGQIGETGAFLSFPRGRYLFSGPKGFVLETNASISVTSFRHAVFMGLIARLTTVSENDSLAPKRKHF